MILIEDLGRLKYGTQGLKKRYGIYECPICLSHFKSSTGDVAKGKTTKCRCCADKISAKAKAQILKIAKDFAEIYSNIHQNKYDYSMVEYLGAYIPILIICPVHGIFYKTPDTHKRGQGCPSCASYGFDKNILYYLKVADGITIVYKIGITNRTVQERFSKTDLAKIQILKTWDFPLGSDARNKEQELIKQYKEYKYTGEPLLQNGNTELFIKDILELDKDNN